MGGLSPQNQMVKEEKGSSIILPPESDPQKQILFLANISLPGQSSLRSWTTSHARQLSIQNLKIRIKLETQPILMKFGRHFALVFFCYAEY